MSQLRERWPPQGLPSTTLYARIIEPITGNDQEGSNNPTVARIYLRPMQVHFAMTVDRIGIVVATANGNGRVGIYRDNGDTAQGGALVVESASAALVANVQEFTIASTVLTPGLYWIACQFSDATASLYRADQLGITTLAGGTLRMQLYNRGGGYGAFTDPCPAITATDSYPFSIYARVASVP